MRETEPIGEPSPATDVRFSLRCLLLVTAVLAVVATTVSALIRQFPVDSQLRLSIYWGILAMLLVGIVIVNARRRFVAEKTAGKVLFRLRTHSYFLPCAPRFATMATGTTLSLTGAMFLGLGSFFVAEDLSEVSFALWMSLLGGSLSGVGVSYLWWNGEVRVCEDGFVVRDYVMPWTGCKRYYWDACTNNVLVTVWRTPTSRLLDFSAFSLASWGTAVIVPQELCEPVERLFREKIEVY